MNHTVIKAVSEFTEVITGGTPSTTKPEYWDGNIPWLNSGALNDGDIRAASKYITELGLKNSSAKLMPKDTVLIALTGATTGQVGYLTFEASANQSVTGILPSKEHHPRYLYYYLKTQRAKIQGDAFGGAQPHINQKYVKDFKIPLPPLSDQKRIAHLLGKVEALIAQRKQHLQQLDDLLKSVFLEMFGDPIRNEKGWDTTEIEKLCEAVIDCPHSTPVYSDEKTGYYCVRSSDIVDGYLDLSKTLQVGRDIYEDRIKRYIPQIGDIVYSREGGRLGNAARILGGELICLGQRIMLFKTSEENSADFLWSLLESQSFKAKLQCLVGGGAAPRVNIKDLKTIMVIQPPNDIQAQFSRITKRIDNIKSHYQQCHTDLESLYGALSQKAFKGELNLSRVTLPIDPEEEPEETVDEEISTKETVDFGPARCLPYFTFPPPSNLEVFNTSKGRREYLQLCFDEFLAQLKDKPVPPLTVLLDDIWLQLGNTREENESKLETLEGDAKNELSKLIESFNPSISLKDYDFLKGRLFETLEQGRFEQKYDDEANAVYLVGTES
ncbi:MAG: restriction modification system specificity domain [Vampirovibrio sp.]|jgi:type I restriction enzyme S subunit|nr:restriction modification system specificity domain [Vampirovibrio sp.]